MNKALIIDTDDVLEALDTAIGLTIGHAEKKFSDISLPKSAVVGIAGELVSGVPIVVNVDRDEPTELITEKEINQVVAKVKEYSFDSIQEEIEEEHGISSAQLEEIDTEVNSISIDGVKVGNPVGLSGTEITYRVFSSFAPRIQLNSIEHIVSQLKLTVEKIVVEPYALSDAFNNFADARDGGIFIDVGSGTTDISVVKNGDIQGIKIFAIGGRVFTKRIQNTLQLTYEEAEKLKISYTEGSIDEYQKKEIKSAIKSDIEAWLLGVELALEEFDEVETFPDRIFICGGGALLPEIMEGLMEYPWIQRLNFQKHPKVSFLFPNKIDDVNDLTRSINDQIAVTPLALTRTLL
ncbi:pilus assembly protein PilM [Candidatus Dojkabacteria bacterium]|uniref:Pilus assembly protein PilM n=1 Tax=Candidatus Dojkabacteria bacterium TaxID=2099670 RepID=A0A955RGL8_9BACT|nr:pilus assembly protein PilM [Candidatus Dojkabacteria bacterium]